MPWPPGGNPVPIDPMLAAVVEGKPAVRLRPPLPLSAAYNNGASASCARTSSAPSPSTSKTQAAGVDGNARTLSNVGVPTDANTDGTRSASDPVPYSGTDAPRGSTTITRLGPCPRSSLGQRSREPDRLRNHGCAVAVRGCCAGKVLA